MARAALTDDRSDPRRDPPTRVKIGLDDDGCQPPGWTQYDEPTTGSKVNPELTVRLRNRNGYDDDGNPVFSWTDVTTGAAIVWTERQEFDDDAGFTLVKATAEILYAGDVDVPETAIVVDDKDRIWRVTAVRQVPGRLGFDLQWIDAEVS